MSAKQKRAEKAKENQIKQEAEKKVEIIRKKKKEAKKKEVAVEKPKPVLKVGDRVRMHDGKAVGSIDTIEKNKAKVNYGLFTTNVSVDLLELVETK
jgi:DNA mismatch repair protein MutS2